jgi:choline dehydrogenase-like flavoprotein
MWQFSPPTRFGSKYRDEIVSSSNVQLYTHAQAVRIDCDPNLRAADAIVIRDPAGRTFAVRAKRYILACNGIQTPRLLLASNHQSPAGVGNSRDLVGRYFCEHVEMSAAELWLKKSQKLPLYVFSQKPRAELALSARAQELHGSLNGSISLHPLNYARKFKSALEVWSDEDPRTNEKRMQAAFEHVHETRWFTRLTTDVYRSYQMFIRVEQAPNANSRITLDDEKDAMGMPRARLHWELGALEKHSIRTICTVIGDEVRRLGIGSVKLLPYLNSAMDSSWPSFTGAGWHHNGTTRMHSDPTRGVVDANCRLHDLENLYVAGESCFPTAGIANPTLTVVALALRLSDHLKTLA